MSLLRNLQVKVLLSALIPGTLILIAVAVIALYTYDATVLDAVGQRDAELARLTADRFSDGLNRQIERLQTVADSPHVRSLDTGRLIATLDVGSYDLSSFDGGVTIYGPDRRAIWSNIGTGADDLHEFPIPKVFDSAHSTLRPVSSGVFRDSRNGRESILIAVPIVARGEFTGVVTGVATLRGPLVSAMFSELLNVSPGDEGLTYLVDGSGRSIFHTYDGLVGADLKSHLPVGKVNTGASGVDLSTSPTGEYVISGFAPVPGTSWGVVTEQIWSEVEGPIRNSGWTMLGLLVLGAAIASAGVWFSTRRALRPVRDLNAGAQRIASGDFDYTIPANTGDEVQELAQQFNVMARALKESYAELEERVALRTRELAESDLENAAIAAIGRVIGSSLDISLVYDRFAEQTRRLIDSDAIAILNVYPARETFSFEYISGITIPGRQPGTEYPLAGTATHQAYRTGEPVLFQPESADQVEATFPGLLPSWNQGLRSFLAAPLISNNEVIGVLWISSRSEAAYAERHAELAARVAAQIAGGIANSQLYEEIQRFYEQEQRRADQFRMIGEVGRRISSILEIDEILASIGELRDGWLGYEMTAVGIVENNELVLPIAANPQLSVPVRRSLSDDDDDRGITGLVASTGQPIIVPDVEKEPRYRGIAEEPDARSSVTVPISAGGQTIGVLHTQSIRPNAFDEADQVVLQALAQEIGIALENARLFQEQQDRAEFFRVVAQLSSRMSSNLDLEEVLSQTAGMIQETFGYYHVGIGLIEGDEVVYKYGAGAPSDNPAFRFDPARLKVGSEGLTGWVASSGSPLLVSDVSADPRYVAMRHASTRSELTIPIRAKGDVIGVLDLQSDHIGDFDQGDLVMLQSLANEAGIAIENARLFEAERRRNEQMAAINAVALNVSAVLTLGELLPHVVQLVREMFGYHTVGVFLVDDDSDEAVLQALDSSDDIVPVRGTQVRIGEEGIVGHVASTGLPWIAADVSKDPFYTTLATSSTETRAELAMPIKQGDIVVGVLDVQSAQLDAFDDTDMLIAQTIANQLAVAIENARIFDETRDLAVLEERNRMAREIHDTLAQGFTGIVIQLEAGEQAIEEHPNELQQHITVAKGLARQCLAEARRSVWNLLPEDLEENPLDVVIATEVERFDTTGGEVISFKLLGARRQLPAVAQAALLRICQESLTNMRKYAEARNVEVTLDFALDSVTLSVADDGVGFDPDAVRIEEGRGGFGLTGMRQRARLLQGDVEIASAPGKGTRVEARIPTT